MEHKLHSYIISSTENDQVPCFSDKIKEDIALDADVQFIWHLISADWDEEVSTTLLDMIISEWVKIRGFSYTSALIEAHEDNEKKTIQKSKGLRKQLQSN